MKPLIPNYPIGSDITIMDAIYHYPEKTENGKWTDDTMTIIYKDNKTREKHSYVIYKPEYMYYYLPYDPGYHQFFIERDKLEAVTCRYHDLDKSIAEKLNVLNFYYDNIKSGNRRENQLLHTSNQIFGSDISINNFYRMKFNEQYTNEITPITRAFLDIETDIHYCNNDFPEPGQVPINAISYFEYDSKKLYTYLLDDPNNPKIEEFKHNCSSISNEFKSFLADTLGGVDKLNKLKLQDISIRVFMFKEEIGLIQNVFERINRHRPDFLLVWNMAFDMPYIIERIKKLGYDPKDIICDREFTHKYCEYYIDERHKNMFEQRGDFADISSYTIYLDQMIQFASRRKGQSVFTNMKLDSIGEQVAGVHKLDYSNITINLGDLPYIDYRTFVKYNMMDVVVQYCIEEKTDDTNFVFNKALQNSTEYKKVHRQTIYLANRAIMRFKAYGDYVCGNNVNKFKDKPNEKYEGAFVSDPVLLDDDVKMKINNVPINLIDNGIDFDYTRLYPSITQEYNLAPNTQIGKIVIPQRVYENENSIHNPKFTRAGAFIEDYTSDNFIEFAHRWFHVGSFEEVYKDIFEYFTFKEIPFDRGLQDRIYGSLKRIVQYYGKDDCLINIVQFIDPDRNMEEVEPLNKEQKDWLTKQFKRKECF